MNVLIILIPISYLLGSIPNGLIVTFIAKRVDIRKHGSGRTGMTNVLRIVGTRAAILVLVLDIAKGVIPVLLVRATTESVIGEVGVGLTAIIGHNWSVFIGFQGGRGIATGLGGMAILTPLAIIPALVIFIPVVGLTRYMSLASLSGVLATLVTVLGLCLTNFYPIQYIGYAIPASVLLLWQHRDNLQRLRMGEERRIG